MKRLLKALATVIFILTVHNSYSESASLDNLKLYTILLNGIKKACDLEKIKKDKSQGNICKEFYTDTFDFIQNLDGYIKETLEDKLAALKEIHDEAPQNLREKINESIQNQIKLIATFKDIHKQIHTILNQASKQLYPKDNYKDEL